MTIRALLVAGLLALSAGRPAGAQIVELTVAVDGLACPFCAYGIEKKLKAVGGVEDVRVDLEAGRAAVTVAAGTVPDFAAVRAAIVRAGFTPREIRLTATGTIDVEPDRIVLQVGGSPARLRLVPGGDAAAGADFTPERRRAFAAWAAAGTPVTVTGTVRDEDGGGGLVVLAVETVAP